MRILISNDDGAFNPALWAMVEAVKDLGDVMVVAPDRDRSGVGAGLTLNDPVRVKSIISPVPGVQAWAVEGTPGDSVILGLKQLSEEPVDLLLSGINTGNNIGTDLIVSGTVGAALQGFLNGTASAAISVGIAGDAESPMVGAAIHDLAESMLEHVTAGGPTPFVNVNFPRISDGPYRGAMLTGLGKRIVADTVETQTRGYRTMYWIQRRASALDDRSRMDPGTDIWAMRHNWVSVTPLGAELTGVSVDGFAARLVEVLDRSVKDHAGRHADEAAG
ncbi:MAG: 5'/3'-nucleotidase SurE [Chloroflexi bacterium]|nr:5'/3'-nucleotidase SurE [Chloroflexota bacterium]